MLEPPRSCIPACSEDIGGSPLVEPAGQKLRAVEKHEVRRAGRPWMRLNTNRDPGGYQLPRFLALPTWNTLKPLNRSNPRRFQFFLDRFTPCHDYFPSPTLY